MTLSGHQELQELLGAYALHALDDDEVAAVEAHLPTCPQCRAETDDLREVTAHLAQTGAPAPEGLWDRIAESINGEAPPPMRLVLGGVPSPAPAAIAGRASRRYRAFTAIAAAAAVVVAVLSVQLVRQQGQLDRTESAVAVFTAADARHSVLRNDAGEVLAVAAVLPSGEGFVQAADLPDLPDGVYQLWGQAGADPVSLGVMDPHGELFRFTADPAMDTLMITAEDAPVTAPGSEPVVLGELALA